MRYNIQNKFGYKKMLILLFSVLILVMPVYSQSLDQLGQIQQKLGSSSGLNAKGASLNLEDLAKQTKDADTEQLQKVGEYVPLDGAVDEDKYIVGPHDLLIAVYFSPEDAEPIVINLPVFPDGCVMIPSVGVTNVSKLTLKDAKKKIIDTIKSTLIIDNVSVYLAQARIFRVHVTGYVNLPGGINATAAYRVSDAIEMAGGTVKAADLSKVNILRDGNTIICNLQEYYTEGKIDSNPFLVDGDVVHLPRAVSSGSKVFVSGAVNKNGAVPIESGMTVDDIVENTINTAKNVDLNNVQVIRNGETKHLDLDLGEGSMQLSDNDKVIIPFVPDSVVVSGHVLNPGKFAYQPNADAKSYIAMAGGPGEDGSMNRISIYRHGKKYTQASIDVIQPGDVIVVRTSIFSATLDFATFMAQIATVVLTIHNINKK